MRTFHLLSSLAAIIDLPTAVLGAPHVARANGPANNAEKPCPTATATFPNSPPKPGNTIGVCLAPPNDATSLTIPSSAPADAPQVPGDFVGFGFETAFLPNYGVGNFTENLMNSIGKRLSLPVIIRIGGTSGDRILFDPQQEEAVRCVTGDCPVGFSAVYSLGPSYFETFRRFQNQHFTFQARMGKNVDRQIALEYATRAYRNIGPERLDGIAMGNEVDVYAGGQYTEEEYVRDTIALEDDILNALDLPEDSRIFQVLDTTDGRANRFSVQKVFDAGINLNRRVKYAAQHWYQIPTRLREFTPESMQRVLLNHGATVDKFNTGYRPAVDHLKTRAPLVDYILSETGSALAGPPKFFQATFGAALWYVDFECYAMSLGVKRIDGSHRPAAPHSLWVPDNSTNDPSLGGQQNLGPQVRGPWFSMPMLADFVGKNPGRVARILENDLATAYAMYDPDTSRLSRVALLNLRFFDRSVNADRGSLTLNVFVPAGVEEVTVQRLRSDKGVYASSYDVQGEAGIVTWAGETWSYELDNGEGHFVDGVARSEKVRVCEGVATISLPDSEAAIMFV